MAKTTIGIFFDKRGMRKGYYMTKWLIYHNGKSRNYSTGFEVTETEVEFLKANKSGLPARIKNDKQIQLWNRVYGAEYFDTKTGKSKPGILAEGAAHLDKIRDSFTFDLFANSINGKFQDEEHGSYSTELLQGLRERRDKFFADGYPSTARTINNTAQSFTRFAISKGYTNASTPTIPLSLITVRFLESYEKWMLKEGRFQKAKKGPDGKFVDRAGAPASYTSIKMYCQNVKTIFNEAIASGVIAPESSPFKKYRAPKSKNLKKALSTKTISEIFYYECKPGSIMEYRRDLWVFSYLCNGMNFTDILNLKWKHVDLSSQTLRFIRQKTKRTKREGVMDIVVRLNQSSLEILDKWATKDRIPENYVFDFLNDSMDAKRKRIVTDNAIRVNNRWMKAIVKKLGYDPETINVNTYSARHSFATTLVRSNAPAAFIQQSFGHASLITTQRYIGSFEDEQVSQYLSALIPQKQEGQDS
ncbi:tyrosine-type recombinase/integrase [Dyadobacter fermentans]|uniref:tyrosine-type recombinase/integrase n=1 Tax=Dyadobacter fermentans TaxID=94254 RepID=UPI001CBE39C5|nr:tyrosine-type recombinase/integrase [Dyadobacter fermentans]MBZ1362122.1 site-specific integrase [Dyadobacter fermentans]